MKEAIEIISPLLMMIAGAHDGRWWKGTFAQLSGAIRLCLSAIL